jgi:hypothetical protein
MNEQDWLACTDPEPMLAFLRGKASKRKLRLFACGCGALVWHSIAHEGNRRAVELAKRLADREEPGMKVEAVRASARDGTAWSALIDSACDAARHAALSGTSEFARSALRGKRWRGREERDRALQQASTAARLAQAGILRDVIGNPFQPVKQEYCLHQWTAWGGGMVRELARAAYDDPLIPPGTLEPNRLAVLADALEDAGCTDAAILGHLREPGAHVRGCWPVDLVLAKV